MSIPPRDPRLPEPLTPLVGRREALTELTALLATSRLLTLTGAGGSGKTRLALELARRVGDGGSDRTVLWVDLAALEDASLIPQQIATAADVREEGTRDVTLAVLDALGQRAHLLVLDNCEHLVEPVALLVERLLRAVPDLTVLATSREPLAIAGERAWLVPPLSLPAPNATATECERTSEAVALFVARVRDTHAAFTVTDETVGAIVEICHRLDGIPLALELAAARVRSLGLHVVASRLDDALAVLATGRRAAVPRHRTLRATMEWSVRLLTPAKQALLRRLGVFVGGFTLDDAEAICAGDPVPADELADLLAQLVERSLVVARDEGPDMRYRLLETVRQYALEQLEASGEAAALRGAHAHWFADLAARAAPRLTTMARREHVARLDAVLENLRVALTWTRRHARDRHVVLAADLCWYWYSSRHWTEGRRWLEEAGELPEASASPATRGRLLLALGVLATLQGEIAVAEPVLREAHTQLHDSGDVLALAYASVYLGMALASQGRPDALPFAESARTSFEAHDELYGLRLAYLILGTIAHARGDTDAAVALTARAVRIARDFRLDRELGIALHTQGIAVFGAGDTERAGRLMRESLRALQRDPSFLFTVRNLEMLALLDCQREAWREGVRRFAAADAARATIGARQFDIDAARFAPSLERARATLGETAFADAWADGAALPLDAAVAEALRQAATETETETADVAADDPHADPGAVTGEHTSVPWVGIRVHALGGFAVQLDGVRVPDSAWRSTRTRELFLYLALHPAGRTREQLGLVFWPDATPAQLKNNFHVTLHHVRRAIGRADAVIIESDRYRLNPDLAPWCDVLAFELAVTEALRMARRGAEARGALRDALRLHRGRLAEGLAFGEWHLTYDDHLQRLAADAWEALGAAEVDAAAWPEAIAAYEALLRCDALHERGVRALMSAWAARGDRTRALRLYDDFVDTLQRELEAEPETVTTALAETLRQPA